MHEEQFHVHNLEIDELSRRNAHLNEQNVRLDFECGRLSEEFQVSLGRLDRQKVGELNKQVSTLTEEKRQLEAKVESVQ